MNTSLTPASPLSYQDWSSRQGVYADVSQQNYLKYLNSWYSINNTTSSQNNNFNVKKDQYVQLIKDLIYLFDPNESDLFLSQIDFNNNDDIVYSIPYLAQKLKEISQIIAAKREDIKNAKTKHSMVGSVDGLEKLLYSYILNNFTKKEYSFTKVPISPLQNLFPELSAVNEDFYIEVEELYDSNNYHDSDPSMDISNYVDLSKILDTTPFNNLTTDEIANLITTRFIDRVAPTPLSKIFNAYLTTIPHLSSSSVTNVASAYKSWTYNQIAANQKFLGSDIYGLTAISVSQANIPDAVLNLNIPKGNSYFYWPSGDKIIDDSQVGSIYKPISINDSQFLLNRTVSGSSYLDSDLIFTDKNGIIEGAWLQGTRIVETSGNLSIALEANNITSFIFPFVGFAIDSKTLTFNNYAFDDSNYIFIEKLDPDIRKQLKLSYFSSTLPNSACYDIYLNQTTLIDNGSYADYFSNIADSITKTPSANYFSLWSDENNGPKEKAYLYKFTKTDIPITFGTNDILWPIMTYDNTVVNLPLTLNDSFCTPINLGTLNPSINMTGSIAGTNFATADVIYKLQGNSSNNAIEAAWLGSGSVSQLNQMVNSISVYSTSAVNCAEYLDGPIQPSLSFKGNAGQYTSFIWCDQDTPADEVFFFHQHEAGCPYGASFPHDFYNNQDYQNLKPLNDSKSFPLKKHSCTCRAVNYSPIGNEGNLITDYNSIADYLFADPQGVGADFSFSSWVDTRNLTIKNSPQFSFYQIDGSFDKNVGFGPGKWLTPTGKPMILKTGRRYTYYRTNFRINPNSLLSTPYLITNYAYKNISANCPSTFVGKSDIVILIDNSRTQTFDLELVKEVAQKICDLAFASTADIQISIISFATNGVYLTYLTKQQNSIYNAINSIQIPTEDVDWQTNILDGLNLANNVLTINQPFNNKCTTNNGSVDFSNTALCSNIEFEIINNSNFSNINNCPRPDATKTIIIFSDGKENVNILTQNDIDNNITTPLSLAFANTLKRNGITIVSVDIGYYSSSNNLMEDIASDNYFYNLQQYITYGDDNINTFTQKIATLTLGCFPSVPVWCKAIRDPRTGNWVESYVPSDMIIRAGDYLNYVHQKTINYTSPNSYASFIQNGISYSMNTALNGWNYTTQKADLSSTIGDEYGARPFWGVINTPSLTSFPFGGQVRIVDEYVPIHQPDVSKMILKNGCFLEYNSNTNNSFRWNQHLNFNLTLTDQVWNKLIFNTDVSVLDFNQNSGNVYDLIVQGTNEPSNLLLDGYSAFKPVFYTYVNRNTSFNYVEDLYYINRCDSNFVTFTSAMVLSANEPYSNLDNVFYPTIANLSLPSTLTPEIQIGGYLRPDKLGASYYRGKGYTMVLDSSSLSYLNSMSAENLFFDINRYASRNRGLTKNDQLTPVTINDIDNRWMIESYSSNNYAGTILDTIKNQKMIPYQTNYEIDQTNEKGLSFISDNFNFWDTLNFDAWTNEELYPTTYRKELILQNFSNRVFALLTDYGTMNYWRSDIYGNNFGLFKDYGDVNNKFIYSEENAGFVTEEGIPFV